MSKQYGDRTEKVYKTLPSLNLSPSFFSQLTIVPVSMVGLSAGNNTLM